MDRLPPQNLDAERSVLGSVLLNSQALDDVADVLQVDQFYSDAHRHVFDAMTWMLSNGQTAFDAVTVGEVLESRGELDAAGGVDYLAELINAVPHSAHARYYADIVRRKAIQRELIYASNESLRDAYDLKSDDLADIDALLARAESRLFGILDAQNATSGPVNVDAALLDAFEAINERVAAGGAISGLATGFTDFDARTTGLHRDELIILAARPSMGKTALALNWALGITDPNAQSGSHSGLGRGVLIFSLEQGQAELAERLVCIQCGQIDGNDIRSGALAANEHTLLMDTANAISARPIYIDDAPGRTVAEIAAISRRKARDQSGTDNAVGLIIVDYLQLIEPDDPKIIREQQVARMTRKLKVLAKELHVPIVVLAQLNRNVEARDDKRPRLSDLRESGAIEQDADVVSFLHRPDAYNPEDNPGLAELIIAKQRGGPTGIVRLVWRKQFMRFVDYADADPYEPPHLSAAAEQGEFF